MELSLRHEHRRLMQRNHYGIPLALAGGAQVVSELDRFRAATSEGQLERELLVAERTLLILHLQVWCPLLMRVCLCAPHCPPRVLAAGGQAGL